MKDFTLEELENGVKEFRSKIKRLEDKKSPIQVLDTSKNFLIFFKKKYLKEKYGREKIPELNSLYQPVSLFGSKTWVVLTLAKDDLEPYFSKEQFKKLKDEDISYIAEKLADALMDCYWTSLEIICENFKL